MKTDHGISQVRVRKLTEKLWDQFCLYYTFCRIVYSGILFEVYSALCFENVYKQLELHVLNLEECIVTGEVGSVLNLFAGHAALDSILCSCALSLHAPFHLQYSWLLHIKIYLQKSLVHTSHCVFVWLVWIMEPSAQHIDLCRYVLTYWRLCDSY